MLINNNIDCCANCKHLVSTPKNNKYGDTEDFCLKTGYFVLQTHVDVHKYRHYAPTGKELLCQYERKDMRDYKCDLQDTVRLLRRYIDTNRPQSFASLYPTYIRQKKQCESYGIKTDIYTDIEQYAKKENIKRFGFTN